MVKRNTPLILRRISASASPGVALKCTFLTKSVYGRGFTQIDCGTSQGPIKKLLMRLMIQIEGRGSILLLNEPVSAPDELVKME
jgi:hypothetical protein